MSDLQSPPLLDDLTPIERDVVNAARFGTCAQPDTVMPLDELETTDDSSRLVRAELIRELLMHRRGDLDPRGLCARGIPVVGELNLDYVAAVTKLTLAECALPDGISCISAQLHDVKLNGSRLRVILLHGAHIGGQLLLDGVKITNKSGPALGANDLRTNLSLDLEGAILSGADEDGTVWLHSARIGGQLVLDGTRITNNSGPALMADKLRTDNDMSLRGAIMTGVSKRGAVVMLGAYVGGQLDLNGAEIANTAGPGLHADRLRTDDNMTLRDATIRGTGDLGAIRLNSAHVGSQLNLDGAEITNTAGPGLHADRLRTNNNMILRNATVTGISEMATVRLIGAHIGYQLVVDRADITNGKGSALDAVGLRADGDMFLREASLRGTGRNGTLELSNAYIGGWLKLDGIRLENTPAGFIYREAGVRVGYASGPLIGFTNAQVAGVLCVPESVVCRHAQVEIGRSQCPDGGRKISVQGLTFPILRDVSWRQWLHLLIHHTDGYSPQPYQHFAAVERASGHDNTARHVLIVQQEDLRRRTPEALGGRVAYLRHWLWGWLGRYGYRAHRLVVALAVVVAIAGGLGYVAGQVPTRPDHHAAERVLTAATSTGTRGTPCSTAELIGLGIDRGLPLGATGLRARCDLDTATRWGQAFTFAIWGLQALVWALATLTVAAYTGLVRKPS